jgi:predicted dehydrogenase
VFATLAEVLHSTTPDVVIVCAPPKAHRAICLEAFAAGTHVLCEKPLGTSVAESNEIIAAAAAAGKRLALNHEFREMPAFRALLEAARADAGGVVFAQAWQNMDLPPWAEPGWRGQLLNGVLYEAGIHLVDFVIAAFGETPRAVTATMSSCGTREEQTDAVALVTLEFSRGRLAQVTQNRLCKGETQYFEVRVDTASASHRVSYGGRARVSLGLLRSRTPHVRLEMGAAGMAWKERGHDRATVAGNPGNAPMIATRNLVDRTLRAFIDGRPPPPRERTDAIRSRSWRRRTSRRAKGAAWRRTNRRSCSTSSRAEATTLEHSGRRRPVSCVAVAGVATHGCREVGPLLAAELEEDGGDRLQHHPDVQPGVLRREVLEVPAHLGAHVLETGIVVLVDLREPREAGAHAVAEPVLRDVFPQPGDDAGPLGARANDVHVAAQDVPELRQLVETELAHHPSERRHAGIVLLCPDRPREPFGIHPHRAELEDGEDLATQVLVPTFAERQRLAPAPIEADACLRVDHRAAGGHADGDRDEKEERREQQEAQPRDRDIERATDGF